MLYVNKIKTPLIGIKCYHITNDQVYLGPPHKLEPSQQVRDEILSPSQDCVGRSHLRPQVRE